MLLHEEMSVTSAIDLLIRWLHMHLHNVYYHQTLCSFLSAHFVHHLLSFHSLYQPLNPSTTFSCHDKQLTPVLNSSKFNTQIYTCRQRRPRLNFCTTTCLSINPEKPCALRLPCTHLSQVPSNSSNFCCNPWTIFRAHVIFRPIGSEYGSYGLNYVDCTKLLSNVTLMKLSYFRSNNTARSLRLKPLKCVHTLEMKDPLHRYGSYLRPYFAHWLSLSNSCLGFFEWLDSQAGRLTQLSGSGKCIVSRSQLDQCRVIYCNKRARRQLQVLVDRSTGRLLWRANKRPVSTNDGQRWIFVIDQNGKMYVHPKQKARFHHSSFVSGEPVLAAGRLQSVDGLITAVSAHSGHYQTPTSRLMAALMLLFGDACLPIVTSDVSGGEKSLE